MTEKASVAIKRLGIELPSANNPVANYMPYSILGDHIYISGQTCKWNGSLKYAGKVGRDLDVETARQAAELSGKNIILQLHNALGDLDQVLKCVKLTVFINSVDDFAQHPQVADGASDLMVKVFGENGKHSRATVGCNSLPGGAAIEIEGVFKISTR
jgi:enamine deaminase RidA (YjgF/YER057c/UK114 family)